MDREQYDITWDDLNPTFLFACTIRRDEDEINYHSHDFIELAIVLKGEGIFYIEGKEHPVKEGELVLLNPGTSHKSLTAQNPENPAIECYLAFSGVHFRDMAKEQMPFFDGGRLI